LAIRSDAVSAPVSFSSRSRQDPHRTWLLAGARQIVTGLNIAKDTNQKIFVTSMCIGTGMGMAALFVSEQN
jgi:hypothetical protein